MPIIKFRKISQKKYIIIIFLRWFRKKQMNYCYIKKTYKKKCLIFEKDDSGSLKPKIAKYTNSYMNNTVDILVCCLCCCCCRGPRCVGSPGEPGTPGGPPHPPLQRGPHPDTQGTQVPRPRGVLRGLGPGKSTIFM